jgi:hypothetical protein
MNDHPDELDDLIDRALPGYSRAEPLANLEQRVLQRIRVELPARRTFRLVRWGFAVPALAAVLLAAVVVRMSWQPLPRPSNARPSHAAPNLAAVKPASPLPRVTRPRPPRRIRQRRGAPVGALPKQEIFPTPMPMTPEEHVLLAWAGQAPAEATRALADLRKRTEEQVSIQEIQIQPLPGDGSQ